MQSRILPLLMVIFSILFTLKLGENLYAWEEAGASKHPPEQNAATSLNDGFTELDIWEQELRQKER
ncbi:MAG: hypothetical protein AAF723_02470, partial [Pseudomonadota bacterium]